MVIDDLHWADELDLLELLEERRLALFPGCRRPCSALRWPSCSNYVCRGLCDARTPSLLLLQLISEEDAGALIGELVVRGSQLIPRAWTAEACSRGNPLFIEQLLALNADGDARNGTSSRPPDDPGSPGDAHPTASTRPTGPSSSVLPLRAGHLHRGAVAAPLYGPAQAALGASLTPAGLKEFIRLDQALFAGDDELPIGHILTTAMPCLPGQYRSSSELSSTRASPTWLEQIAPVALSSMRRPSATDLEQAHRYHERTWVAPPRLAGWAKLAPRRLARTWLRAQARGDMPAAWGSRRGRRNLRPWTTLVGSDLLPELAAALMDTGDSVWAEATLREATERARACGNELAVCSCHCRPHRVAALVWRHHRRRGDRQDDRGTGSLHAPSGTQLGLARSRAGGRPHGVVVHRGR